MATISKGEVILPNGKKFMKVVKYNLKKGFNPAYFSIDLPEEIIITINQKQVIAKSEDEVNSLFKDALQQYKNAAKTVQKNIVIKLDADLIKIEYSSYQYNNDYKLSFNWGVYEKILVGEKYSYNFLGVGYPVIDASSLRNFEQYKREDIKFMPWSEARQSWCELLDSSFKKMIENVQKFMKENDNETFAAKIEAGTVKLLNF